MIPRPVLAALLALAAAALVGCAAGDDANVDVRTGRPCPTPMAGSVPAPCWRPYSDDSPFNRRVVGRPPLANRSPETVDQLSAWGGPGNVLVGAADTSRDYGHPVFYARSSDPVFRIHCVRFRPCEVEGHRIRIPDDARPADGGDGHMAVVDFRTGWEYDFWQVRSKPRGGGRLVVSHGGRTRISGDGLGSNATAAGFGLLGGIVRPHELARGRIRHALFLTVRCSNGRSVFPAARGTSGAPCRDFGEPGRAAPSLGARVWLSMSREEIARLRVPPWKRAILHALRDYGGIVGDTMRGNGSWAIVLESGESQVALGRPDPWRAIATRAGASPYEGLYVLELDDELNWQSRLRVVAPCVSRGDC